MIILIPIGGIGSRFKKNGYNNPKALINVLGKPIIFWLLDNLILKQDIDFIYIPYNKEYQNYRLEDLLKKNYPHIKFKFFMLSENTRGAAETINIALKDLCKYSIEDQPILCLDSDNFYIEDILLKWRGENKVFVFRDEQDKPIYSYVDIRNEVICDIVEKTKISNNACTGAYAFDSWRNVLNYTNEIIINNIKDKNEFYTSTVIKQMIKKNIQFYYGIVKKKNYICLGTPLQIRLFCNNFPRISALTDKKLIKPMRYCFDLDNTLITFPKKYGDYRTVFPIHKNINFLKYLHSFGHTIIIYTARRMKTHGGNNGKLLKDIGKITFDTLEKFEIPYDEIYFGKPYANFYIDDLAINCCHDIEKELGFYNTKIEPRDFNSIESVSIEVYKKKSDDLSGEIYYYQNIPKNIKDMFPIFIDHDNDNKWYNIERINGITANEMYLSGILEIKHLKHIMNSLKRIHLDDIQKYDNNVDIYHNYSNKIIKRFQEFDYSKFENSNKIYEELIESFKIYKNAKISIIHGDPVLTNILFNNFGKIKFIDMRGKLGEKKTILGDSFYDWAKLYQSLIGYDEILLDKQTDGGYKIKMINFFKNYIVENYSIEDFQNIKLITKSLLFTLIPLHNNIKCKEYYNLIFCKYLKDDY
jgi:capsule biosynthesis phosphatase